MMVFEVMGYTIVGYGYHWTVTRNGVYVGSYTDTWVNIRNAIILKKSNNGLTDTPKHAIINI